MRTPGLLVAGTTSDAGKSVVTTGICRAFARRGLRVAPYKAQNMSNNSMVVPLGHDADAGFGEIGRAQWVQALAARATPEVAMNPVLLKPGSDRRSHAVVMGRPGGVVDATDFVEGRRHLAQAAHAAFDDLAARHDVVVAEGAGSPTEINLRASDYVNLGLAQHARMPVRSTLRSTWPGPGTGSGSSVTWRSCSWQTTARMGTVCGPRRPLTMVLPRSPADDPDGERREPW